MEIIGTEEHKIYLGDALEALNQIEILFQIKQWL